MTLAPYIPVPVVVGSHLSDGTVHAAGKSDERIKFSEQKTAAPKIAIRGAAGHLEAVPAGEAGDGKPRSARMCLQAVVADKMTLARSLVCACARPAQTPCRSSHWRHCICGASRPSTHA